ncbi:MAG: N-acetylmuramoyl-L-alanine amidase [Bacteroidota bacterium]
MIPKEVPSLLRPVVLFTLCLISFSVAQAVPVQSSINIDFLVNQAGKEEINILQTPNGLMSHRRNLEAVYISQRYEIPIQNAYPFLTFAPVGEVDNYRKEGFHFNVRFSSDGSNWSDWEELGLFHEIKPDDPRYIGEMQYLEDNERFFEFMIVLSNDAITLPPVRLRNLKLDFFNPNVGRAPGDFREPGDKESFSQKSSDSECDCAQPDFSDRVAWNCPDGNEFSGSGAPVMTDVTHLIVHHSAGPNTSTNWSAAVLSIWNLHKNTNGWDDIGYNWLIDPDGVIYEGRGGGNNVRGAHFCGKNTGTMGICFLGNFETATPTPEALASLETLLAWKSCDSGLEPKGTSLHASSGLTLHTISGHRDGCNTLCPGANLFPLIASRVRDNTDSILTACTTITSLNDFDQISELKVYPNPSEGDIEVSWTAIKSGEVLLEVLNYQGQVFMQRDVNLFFGRQSLQLNFPHMSSGIYLLRFRNKKGTLTHKIVLL